MDGFTKLPKMQHFKEGGSVQREVKNFTKRDRKSVDEADTAQDKAIVKKAIHMHDEQEHHGETTDLSKLKKGGRAKKELGTARKFIKPADSASGAKKEPNKYKTGGTVGVYGAKKKSGDLDSIEKAKDIKPKLLCGGGKAYKTGGGVKKMAVGGSTLQDLMQAKELARLNNARKYLGKGQQGEFAGTEMNQTPAMTGMGQTPAPMPAPAPAVQAPAGTIPAQKRGGKVKKMNTGGTCP